MNMCDQSLSAPMPPTDWSKRCPHPGNVFLVFFIALRGWQFVTTDQTDLNELADSESGNPDTHRPSDIFLSHDKFVGGSGPLRGPTRVARVGCWDGRGHPITYERKQEGRRSYSPPLFLTCWAYSPTNFSCTLGIQTSCAVGSMLRAIASAFSNVIRASAFFCTAFCASPKAISASM